MADLAIQKITLEGTEVAYAAASVGGDTFANAGQTFLVVKNGDIATHTVTINSVTKCSHGFDHDLVVPVAAGATKQIGPFKTNRFNNGASRVSATYDGVTALTVAALSLEN